MTYRAGDVFVATGSGLFDRIVQFGQHWRFPALDAKWSHAGIIVSDAGDTVEAQASGVRTGTLTADRQVRIIAIEPEASRQKVVAIAKSRLGERYGWATIACLVLRLLPPARLTFGVDGSLVCSGLVALAMEGAGDDMGDTPADTYPAQLAAWADQHSAWAAVTPTIATS